MSKKLLITCAISGALVIPSVAMAVEDATTTQTQTPSTEPQANPAELDAAFGEKETDSRGELVATQPAQVALNEGRTFRVSQRAAQPARQVPVPAPTSTYNVTGAAVVPSSQVTEVPQADGSTAVAVADGSGNDVIIGTEADRQAIESAGVEDIADDAIIIDAPAPAPEAP